MKRTITLLFALMILLPTMAQQISEKDKLRAAALVNQMTLEEKIDYIGGDDYFFIRSIPRLGIPQIRSADGPQGIRNETNSTMFPCGIAAAATWDRNLIYNYGKALGQDARARGVHIILGPAVNIYRSPLCGRNFEYFGEDPYLASETAVAYIKGVQSQGVMATIKHFVGNNQEWDRLNVSSDIDERTLNEIYLTSFRKAVKNAGVGGIMASFNLLNSVHMTENRTLNIDILRKKWGFEGILLSDWGATYSAMGAVNGGLDLEMPKAIFMTRSNLIPLIKSGVISEATIDEKCQHILQTFIAFGFLDREQIDKNISEQNAFSDKVALDVARSCVVMLKNEGEILPLSRKIHEVVVMGPNAGDIPTGGGSGFVNPFSTISVGEGMQQEAPHIHVDILNTSLTNDLTSSGIFYTEDGEMGLKCEFFDNKEMNGTPIISHTDKIINYTWGNKPIEGVPDNYSSIRWSGILHSSEPGYINFRIYGNNKFRLYIDNKEIIFDWKKHFGDSSVQIKANQNYKIDFEYCSSNFNGMLKYCFINDIGSNNKIKNADAVIYCAGFNNDTEREACDRTFSLPDDQVRIIREIAEINSNLIVIVNSGGGINFAELGDKVRAILMAWYPGQEGGRAIAEIITGKRSPCGKLPISIERKIEDNPTYGSYYENVYRANHSPYIRVSYKEGVFMGYRGYQHNNIEPLYPFGFGLSYSTFDYSNLKIEKQKDGSYRVEFDIKNTGRYNAAEIAQIYIGEIDASVPRPIRELKEYGKVSLKKGETKHMIFELHHDAFAYYDIQSKDFVVKPGKFTIEVGASSRDIKLKGIVEMK